MLIRVLLKTLIAGYGSKKGMKFLAWTKVRRGVRQSLILFKHKGREIKGDHIFWTHIFTPETIAGGP